MPRWVAYLVISLALLAWGGASLWLAPRNLQMVALSKQVMAQPPQSAAQAEVVATVLGERRGALYLLITANRLGRAALQDQIERLQRIVERGWWRLFTADEVDLMVKMQTFQSEVLYNAGRFAEALTQSEQILTIAPDRVEGLIWSGTALGNLKRYAEAEAVFQRAQQLYPESPFVLSRTAYYEFYWSPQRTGLGQARVLIERTLQIEPTNRLALRMSIEDLIAQNDCTTAYARATFTVQTYPTWSGAYVLLGHAEWCQGQQLEARQHYQRALELQPELAPYLKDRLAAP